MRVFLVGSNLPEAGHTVRAPTVVMREALLGMRGLGHDVVFQPLLPLERDPRLTENEERSLEWARHNGIDVLSPLQTPVGTALEGRIRLARESIAATPELFNPAYLLRDEMARRVDESGADVALHLWSSPGLAACSTVDRPVYAYYGNPDHKPLRAQLRNPQLFDLTYSTPRNKARLALWKLANRNRRRVNIRLMERVRWSANVCAVDADYYAAQGHPHAFYVQNMWPDLVGPGDHSTVNEQENKIVGNLGGLYGTGNTFGLWYLAREVLPELDRQVHGRCAIHLYGAGELRPSLARALEHPNVHMRGFVDDIDAEMHSAKLFLILNNNHPDFIVGHTRILHAWSLGLCLIAHRNMALAVPEIVHGENALLGSSGEEIAGHVAAALRDPDLRRAIAAGGRRTFEREFLPPTVVGRVMKRIEDDLATER